MIYDLSSCSRKSEREIMTLQCPSFYVAKCWDRMILFCLEDQLGNNHGFSFKRNDFKTALSSAEVANNCCFTSNKDMRKSEIELWFISMNNWNIR